MRDLFRTILRNKCEQKIEKRHKIAWIKSFVRNKRKKRIGYSKTSANNSQKTKRHPQYDPQKVLKDLDFYVDRISQQLANGKYKPIPAFTHKKSKGGGKKREITSFSIVDNAVGGTLYHHFLNKYQRYLSSSSFGFCRGRNAHTAISHIHTELNRHDPLIVLELDFKSYFDSIRHDYLLRMCDKIGMTLNEIELIKNIIRCRYYHNAETYENSPRQYAHFFRGIPQGNSTSLFLANLACFELDKEIENTGARFARYVDDMIIICDNNSVANECLRLLTSHYTRSWVRINPEKSDGLSIFSPLLHGMGSNYLVSKTGYSFLAHSISGKTIDLSSKRVNRIKAKVSRIIYDNLILHPKKRNRINPGRFTCSVDWDLVNTVDRLRYYIYGKNISEKHLRLFLANKAKYRTPFSAMAFHPLVNTDTTLKQLDGWLVDVLKRALIERGKLLASTRLPVPKVTTKALIYGTWYDSNNPKFKNRDVRLPSFVRSWKYVKKVYELVGDETMFPSPYSSS